VLGAGGSGRAAAFGLRDKGAEVFLLNRTPEHAAKLAKQSGAKVIKREQLAKSSFDVIINATPIGMSGNTAEQLITAADFEAGLKTKIVFDLVYNPVDTPLIRLARQLGIPIITGVEMFVQQGARQFEIWTGKPAPEEEMLKVVLHSLRQGMEPATETPAPVAATETPAPEPVKATPVAAKPSPIAAKPAKAAAPVVPAKKADPVKKVIVKVAVKPAAKKPTATKKTVVLKTKMKAKAR
jgi:3-dehydroquinate dehydratase/shikimate dehydrogenase